MKKRNYICCFIFLLIIPALSMGQWQANMINSISGGEKHYKVYSNLNQYRYEFNEDGMSGVVIANPETNITAIMLLDEKKVHYTALDGMLSSMNDPVQAYNNSKAYAEEKIIGNETIAGYECIKKELFQGEQKLFSQWFSEELNFPVKLVGHWAENNYMQLNDIQEWDADPAFFVVPDDFMEVDENLNPVIPEPPPPDTWDTKEVNVPVDLALSRGMAVNVSIDETVYHKFIVENTGDTPAKFSYHSFIDGVELSEDIQGPEEYRTQRLYIGEDYKMTMNWKAGQVILIKVYEGEASLQIIKE